MSNIQAALCLAQFERLEELIEKKGKYLAGMKKILKILSKN